MGREMKCGQRVQKGSAGHPEQGRRGSPRRLLDYQGQACGRTTQLTKVGGSGLRDRQWDTVPTEEQETDTPARPLDEPFLPATERQHHSHPCL